MKLNHGRRPFVKSEQKSGIVMEKYSMRPFGNMKGARCRARICLQFNKVRGIYYIDLEKSLLAFERENTTTKVSARQVHTSRILASV